MGERGPKGGKVNRAGVQKAVRNIVERGKWYGYEVDTTKGPADIVAEELTQSYAIASYIKDEIARNFPQFSDLSLIDIVVTDAGASTVSTQEAAWLEWAMRERDHLIRVAKLAHDIGIDEKRIALAETHAELMFRVVTGLIDAMGLSDEQKQMVPKLLPTLIRQHSVGYSEEPAALEVDRL